MRRFGLVSSPARTNALALVPTLAMTLAMTLAFPARTHAQITEGHTKKILSVLYANNPKLSVIDGVVVSIPLRVEASGLRGDMANEYKFNLGVTVSATKFHSTGSSVINVATRQAIFYAAFNTYCYFT